jgi:hypothetical protein
MVTKKRATSSIRESETGSKLKGKHGVFATTVSHIGALHFPIDTGV